MKRARLWAALFVAAYCFIQVLGLRFFGLTDDDDFYIPAGISYAAWAARAITFQDGALSRAEIDRVFEQNHEHPPFAKYVFGMCHSIFRFLRPTDAARMGTVLFSSSIALLLMMLALRHFGERRGLWIGGISTFLLLTLPRFYFHSHAATLDVPVAAMVLMSAAVALYAERSKKAAILAGPIFGLALATKLNAPFFLVAYVVFFLLVRWRSGPLYAAAACGIKREQAEERPRALGAGVESAFALKLPNVPIAFLSMLILGPLVFIGVWPWLWFDTFQRIGAYIGFHLHHYGIYFLYFGHVYDREPFAPWHAPFVMAATTMPLVTLMLGFVGIRFALPAIANRLRFTAGPDDDRRKEGDLLLMVLLNAVVTISAVAFSGGAKYGGEKLFMPFFPFWCLLGGYGAYELFALLRATLDERARRFLPALGALCAASPIALSLDFGGYALSEYNALAQGLRGATALGFERQYYDVAYRDLVRWLDENAPQNLRIHFLPNNWEYVRTYNWYKKNGELRADIQVVNAENEADWIVITHERRFTRYGDDLRRYRTRPIVREKILDGTPIWSIVKAR